MFRLELKTIGFSQLFTQTKDKVGNTSKNSLTIYGNGFFDRIVFKFFELLSNFFADFKPIEIKLASSLPTKLFARKGEIRQFIAKEIKQTFKECDKEKKYQIGQSDLVKSINKIMDAQNVIALKQTLEKLNFNLSLETHFKMAKTARDLQISLQIQPDIASTLKHPIFIHPKTGEICFNGPTQSEWVKGVLAIDNDKLVKITFDKQQDEKMSYFVEKLKKGLQKHLNGTDKIQEAVLQFSLRIKQKEFEKFVEPAKLEDLSNAGVVVEIKNGNSSTKKYPLDANYINFNQGHYIASVGPQKKYKAFFWEMIFQNKSPLIVKLNEVVKTPDSSDQSYWPALNETFNFDGLNVKTTQEEIIGNALTKRTLEITKESEKKTVIQLDYTGWPDNNTPTNKEDLKRLIELIPAQSPIDEPITVHCTLGIGRTGTFLALLGARHLPQVPTRDLVLAVREQRPGKRMVETAAQYALIEELRSKE